MDSQRRSRQSSSTYSTRNGSSLTMYIARVSRTMRSERDVEETDDQ